MTTHEKIVRQALKSVMDQLGKIDALINERPLSGIIDLRIAAQKIITEHKGNYKRIGELIGPLAEEEKRLFSVAKKQEGSTLWDKKFKLQCEYIKDKE